MVSLQIILKDEVDKVVELIQEANSCFDAINITVSDKKAYNTLKANNYAKYANIEYREWTDDFSEARNANMAMCKTRYLFWCDADDKFDFSEIPKLVDLAEKEGYEAIYLPYNYARDEHGRVVAVHTRERLIRTDVGFEWRGALHETLIIDRQFRAKRLDHPVIEHDSPNIDQSIERNHKILLKKSQEEPVDPRYLHYLGLSYCTLGEYEKAISTFAAYIKVGGWDEEIYRSLIKMSESSSFLDKFEDAMNYALQAAGVLPSYPQAYFCLAQYEFAESNWKQCLEWLKVAFSKPQPKTMSIVDPTMIERAKVMGASSEFQLKNYREAETILSSADDPSVKELMPIFSLEASKERFIEIAPAITKHVDPKMFYDSLKEDLKYDQRMQWLRYSVKEPKVWPKKSIVWFCGQGFEEWGPHTLDKGMGGSEEAVVYLSREMAKLGYTVTVYGAVNEPTFDVNSKLTEGWEAKDRLNNSLDNPLYSGGTAKLVTYKPWRMFDTRDEFDTLIVWRAPHGIDQLKARVKILDMHDKLEAKDVYPFKDVTYAFKSAYHRNLYPHLDDKQAAIIGNGIVKGDFK
jgi:tetratricopeptide (TPR) repeat protein